MFPTAGREYSSAATSIITCYNEYNSVGGVRIHMMSTCVYGSLPLVAAATWRRVELTRAARATPTQAAPLWGPGLGPPVPRRHIPDLGVLLSLGHISSLGSVEHISGLGSIRHAIGLGSMRHLTGLSSPLSFREHIPGLGLLEHIPGLGPLGHIPGPRSLKPSDGFSRQSSK